MNNPLYDVEHLLETNTVTPLAAIAAKQWLLTHNVSIDHVFYDFIYEVLYIEYGDNWIGVEPDGAIHGEN